MVKDIRKKGQVTLLAVILGVLGLTLGLSVASRSLSDLRQASTVDFGTKALAAAEAGVEYGLSRLNLYGDAALNCDASPLPNVASTLNFPPELGIKSLTYEICKSNDGYARSNGPVNKDDVFQVNFSGYNGSVNVSWAGTAEGVQINALYLNAGTYSVARYAYRNPPALGSSNFSDGFAGSSSCGGVSLPGGRRSAPITGVGLVLLRVTPVGGPDTANADILVCGSTAIPAQYYEVTATAETTNGTKRRVSVRRDIAGTLPGVFDNVLFSGGDINKF